MLDRLPREVRGHLLWGMRVFLLTMGAGFLAVAVLSLVPGISSGMISVLQGHWPDITPRDLCDKAALGGIACFVLEGILGAYKRVIRPLLASV